MINKLIKLADHLDRKGLFKEANLVDEILQNNPEHSDGMMASGGETEEDIDRILAELKICLKKMSPEGRSMTRSVARAFAGQSDSDDQDED